MARGKDKKEKEEENQSPKKEEVTSPSKESSKTTELVVKIPIKKSKKPESDEKKSEEKKSEPTVILPAKPKDSEGKKFYEILEEFVLDKDAHEYDFPTTLSAPQRKLVHDLAEEFGLDHFSRGSKIRYITVEKKTKQKVDEIQLFGYIGAFGPSVDSAAESDAKSVPSEYIQKRIKRDGPINHITILSRDEIDHLIKIKNEWIDKFDGVLDKEQAEKWSPREQLVRIVAELVTDDWEDLGLGRVIQGKNTAWFKVIEWKSAAEFRKKLGLSDKDFHITIGFILSDIHSVTKNRETLVNKETKDEEKTETKEKVSKEEENV